MQGTRYSTPVHCKIYRSNKPDHSKIIYKSNKPYTGNQIIVKYTDPINQIQYTRNTGNQIIIKYTDPINQIIVKYTIPINQMQGSKYSKLEIQETRQVS